MLISPNGEDGSGVRFRSWLRRLVLGGLFVVACWAGVAVLTGQARAATPLTLPAIAGPASGNAAGPAADADDDDGQSPAADARQQGQSGGAHLAGLPPSRATPHSYAPGLDGTATGKHGSTPGRNVTAPGQGGTPPGQGGTPPGQGGTPPGRLVSGAARAAAGSVAALLQPVESASPAPQATPPVTSPLSAPAVVAGVLAAPRTTSGDAPAAVPPVPVAGPRSAGPAAAGRTPGAPAPGIATAAALASTRTPALADTRTPLPLTVPLDQRPAPWGLAPTAGGVGSAEGGPRQAHEGPLAVVDEREASLAGAAPRADSVPPAVLAGALPERAPRPD